MASVDTNVNEPDRAESADTRRGPGLQFWLAFWSIPPPTLPPPFGPPPLLPPPPRLPTPPPPFSPPTTRNDVNTGLTQHHGQAISAAIGGDGSGQTEAFWAGTSYLLACTVVLL